MPIDSSVFMHDSDRAALQALKAIPGFTPLLKAYMKVWSEQQFRIQNMATNLRISEKQMPKYYNMLLPICEKLGIEVPELYLELDVRPNAYTSGDTKPFIVMTSGLLETLPESLIPSVLAHECGHIACHHVLYHTMGRMILNETTGLLGLSDLISFPIQVAFYYWMRCSELSADRAAAICDGNATKVVETCLRFAGYDKDIGIEANVDAFMEQAIEYKAMVEDSKWNKTLEFLMYNKEDHPLNAVRAYECNEWAKTQQFEQIRAYLEQGDSADNGKLKIPMLESAKHYIGLGVDEAKEQIIKAGFISIELERVFEKGKLTKEGQVVSISIDGQEDFKAGDWYARNSKILIRYYKPKTEEEVAIEHSGQIRVPDSAKKYIGREYGQVVNELKDAGFLNVLTDCQQNVKKSWLTKDGNISRITIGGDAEFEKGAWYQPESVVRILYYDFSGQNEQERQSSHHK